MGRDESPGGEMSRGEAAAGRAALVSLDRLRALLSGCGAGALAGACLFAGWPLAACVALALAPYLVSLRGRPDPSSPCLGTALAAGTLGLGFSLWSLGAAWPWAWVLGLACVLAGLALPSTGCTAAAKLQDWRPLALLLGGAGAALALRGAVEDALRVNGSDAGSFAFALAPLLLAAALGAGILTFLSERHARLGPWLLPLAAAAAALCLALETLPPTEVLEAASRIQGPSVNRRHFLFGVSLLALTAGGWSAALVGAQAAALLRAVPRVHGLAVCAGSACLGLIPAATQPIVAACVVVLLGAAAAARTPSTRVFLALGALAALFLAPRHHGAWWEPYVQDDPILLADGAAEAPPVEPELPPDPIDGRLPWPAAPPGWPFASQPLPALLQLLREADPSGQIELMGAEAENLARRAGVAGVADRVGADPHAQGVLVLLPSLFADPLPDLPRVLRRVDERLAAGRSGLALGFDLGETSAEEVALICRSALRRVAEPLLLLQGTTCCVAGFPDAERTARLRERAVLPLPVAALSAEALARLAQEAHAPEASLLLRPGRARPASRSPATAARNLALLLRAADLLDAPGAAAPRGMEPRIRLELARAILEDDAGEEDRLLALLERTAPAEAARLRREREAARARLLAFLFAARDEDPFDADVRFRLGALLRRSGRPAAAIEDLTRCVELRPKLLRGVVETAEAYLAAEEMGYRRRTPAGPIDGLWIIIDETAGLPRYTRELDEPLLTARWHRAVGRAWLMHATRPGASPAARLDELHTALGRFFAALQLDPRDAEAERLMAEAMLLQGRAAQALEHARRAVALAPLDARARAQLAATTQDADERQRAAAAFFSLAPAFLPPWRP